jgi:aarF domain-containing kinase
MFESLGSTYIKFGQFIASASGIVGEDVAKAFRSCLDTGPPVPFDRVRATVESELGQPLHMMFAEFEETAAAAASISVVHRARRFDGTAVAVKVLRPGIERLVSTDLAIIEGLSRFLAARGIDQGYNLVSLIVGLRAQIAEELDLRNEARAMTTFGALFERYELSLLVVPQPDLTLSGRRVLTMDWLDGAPIDDLDQASAMGIDVAPLVRELLRAWVLTAIRTGAFHADIHAGNLLLLRDGRLGMIDWGIVSRMDGHAYRMFRCMCEASIGREGAWEEMGEAMLELVGPTLKSLGLKEDDTQRLIRGMFEPVLTLPISEIDMSALLMTGDDVIQKATGVAPPPKTVFGRVRAMRAAARAYQDAAREEVFSHPTMRMSFLSMKQLIYLERYARAYIPEELLLGDKEFVRRALGD